ncbi:MaoC/PaaZ C-terminal domain-containing protein [Novosphingobium naphthalenivorans]|jgi:acyl dehydratase|uniref:MaoC/PaaZ C-terminal domain-containing protein n=1 Tax=Novosphingobium naphthalenivorans TaxID=273168 RepID=UPI000832874F|nr:MaoC/PaaZ C-terminal domain-containing protein [Novosphingobium naphthalenivorans]
MPRSYVDPEPKWFEDFESGDTMTTRGRTVDIGDITNYAGLTGDHYQLHTDAAFMANNRFGQRIAHGPLTFSLAVGLVGLSGFYGDAIVALIEITGLKATKPVFAGDTLHVVATVTTHDASGPKYGTLGVTYSVRNQHDDEVMTFLQTMLAKRRQGEQ